jgi:GH25 family lysozyme M1 (1,4-beta-N-acetylmuramidase)
MKRLQRTGCALLAALMLLPGAALAGYSDTSGNWAEGAIEKWSGQYQILQGYEDGTFRPDGNITRGAFATIMDRFLQYLTASDSSVFSDISGEWCESSVLKLNAANVFLGTDGKALIYNSITRQQAVIMIARAFGLGESSAPLSYADADSVADYAKGYLSTMTQMGFITDVGDDACFRPTDAITRAEVVNILNNMVNELYQASGVYSEAIDGTLMINAAGGATLKDMDIGGDLIVAPGVTGTVSLDNVTVEGSIRNLGSAVISTDTTYIDYNGRQVPVLPSLAVNGLTTDNFSWADYNSRRFSFSSDAYTARMGIDVSRFQGDIDWNAVAGDGVQYALVRCGGRGTTAGAFYTDSKYAQNVDGAYAAGLETGVYFFAQAISVEEAEAEADYVLNLLQGHNINGMVVYDWEILGTDDRTYGVDPEMVTACAKTFCDRIEAAGYQAGVYFTEYVGYLKYDLSQLTDYNFWFANYAYKYPHFYYQVNYWQYTSSGTVAGIDGKVDMDLQFIRN